MLSAHAKGACLDAEKLSKANMTITRIKQSFLWLGIAAILAAADQLSKAVVEMLLPLGAVHPVSSFFNFVHTLNPGAAFSFLADASGWQWWFFTGIALVVSIVLVSLILRHPTSREVPAYALIVGGAMGNLIDRLTRGAVVDWLDFYWDALHWPAFNLADVWIVSGAALMLVKSFQPQVRDSRA